MTNEKSDNLRIHIDSSEVDPKIAKRDGKCPEHGTQDIQCGFGLAGGGYGVYNYCGICGCIVDKSPEQNIQG